MFGPAQIAVEKRAQIIHSVFEHRQPIDPAPEREALPFVGIEPARGDHRSEEHTSELQSLMRSPYAVFCLKNTKQLNNIYSIQHHYQTLQIQHTLIHPSYISILHKK